MVKHRLDVSATPSAKLLLQAQLSFVFFFAIEIKFCRRADPAICDDECWGSNLNAKMFVAFAWIWFRLRDMHVFILLYCYYALISSPYARSMQLKHDGAASPPSPIFFAPLRLSPCRCRRNYKSMKDPKLVFVIGRTRLSSMTFFLSLLYLK